MDENEQVTPQAETQQAAPTNTEAPSLDFAKITAPEGVVFDDAFKSMAGESKLTNEQVTSIANYYKNTVVAQAEEARNQLLDKWEADSKTEFTGEKLEIAKRAYNQLADPELKQFMDETGLGNNPAVIRLFHKIGVMTSEGKLAMGEGHDSVSPGNKLFAKSIGG